MCIYIHVFKYIHTCVKAFEPAVPLTLVLSIFLMALPEVTAGAITVCLVR